MPVPKEIRTKIWNMDTEESIFLQFEPEIHSGSVTANYGGEQPLAAPHSPLIYGGTASERFPVKIRFERIPLQSRKGISPNEASDIIDDHIKFLRSLLVPSIRPEGIIGGDTPLLFLETPGVMGVFCKAKSLGWEVPRRDPQTGRIVSYTAQMVFEEDPQYWYTSEELRVIGNERS